MNGRVLLATNIIIALFAGEPGVLSQLAAVPEVFIPAVVIGELYHGALRSDRAKANVAQVEALASTAALISCDAGTARHYAGIKNELRTRGRPIPENDIWIAAGALQHNLVVVSRDLHFSEIAGLAVEAW